MLPYELEPGRGIRPAPSQKPPAHSCLCLQLLPRPLATHTLVNHSSGTFSLLGFLSESTKSKPQPAARLQGDKGLPNKPCRCSTRQGCSAGTCLMHPCAPQGSAQLPAALTVHTLISGDFHHFTYAGELCSSKGAFPLDKPCFASLPCEKS